MLKLLAVEVLPEEEEEEEERNTKKTIPCRRKAKCIVHPFKLSLLSLVLAIKIQEVFCLKPEMTP